MKNISSKPKKKTTIFDVAKEAGVSPSTVSRILNSTTIVSESKKKRVEAAIKKLKFSPDFTARSLSGGKTMSIGVLTQYIDSPFYSTTLRGIEIILREANYIPLFVSGRWEEEEQVQQLQFLKDRKVDGIIILTSDISNEKIQQFSKSIPVIVTGREFNTNNVFSISFDDINGMRLAVKHLYELKHKKIAFISGPSNHKDARQRLNSFKSVMISLGLVPDVISNGDYREAGGFSSMVDIIKSKKSFSAIVCANDQMAYGAMLALSQFGFRIPEDVSLIGFDNLPHSAYTIPPLTTIKQSITEIGRMSAKSILKMLDNKEPDPYEVNAELVIRQSVQKFNK